MLPVTLLLGSHWEAGRNKSDSTQRTAAAVLAGLKVGGFHQITGVSIKAGWSSGLRRQLQVLFSSGGVGSNPTPVKLSCLGV